MHDSHLRMFLITGVAALIWAAGAKAQDSAGSGTITEADCTSAKLGESIPVTAIGELVSAVTLSAPEWTAAAKGLSSYCSINGAMAPIDPAPNAQPINFQVAFPVNWNGRSAQLGGGGMNGFIPPLTAGPGAPFSRGFVTYGSDSGHQAGGFGFGRSQASGPPPSDDWALNDEAIKNLGYMQMKKTHDAAMVLIERMYGTRPKYNYYIGTSQGGREALTVAERYPDDYDGIAANVPIVGFSSLMLAPALIRIQEKPAANWVTARESQRDPRRVHAAVRQARRPGGRHHQQLHGLPRDLRREAGQARTVIRGRRSAVPTTSTRIRPTRARTRA